MNRPPKATHLYLFLHSLLYFRDRLVHHHVNGIELIDDTLPSEIASKPLFPTMDESKVNIKENRK